MTMATTANATSQTVPRLAVVCGSTITTWDCQNDTEPFTFYPHPDLPLSDIAWNHNGQVLASCTSVSTDEKTHDNIVLSEAKSGAKLDSFQHNLYWTRSPGRTTSLAFGGKSRYLCMGDTTGAVCLWDLKKRARVRQLFHDGHPSLQACVDPTDTYVLSISERLFSIFNLRQGTLERSFSPDGPYEFTCFHISQMEPHVAAVGTNDGSILLYDITDDVQLSPFLSLDNRHSGSITGLAVSPRNSQLLATASSFGTLTFFDTTSGETIQEFTKLDGGITSLDFHSDGTTCAVGTQTGEVYIYDLRKTTPIASLRLRGQVSSLKFSPFPKPKEPLSSTTVSHRLSLPPKPKDPHETIKSPHSTIKAASRRSNNINNNNHDTPGAVGSIPAASTPPSSSLPITTNGAATAPATTTTTTTTKSATMATPMSQRKFADDSRTDSRLYTPATVATEEKMADLNIPLNIVRELIGESVDHLRDDMEESIRNLHMDMIRQFHLQSQEISNTLASQMAIIERLNEENEKLREENEILKQGQQL